ncbi:MAG TPA: zinc ribbon domain-containing protein [Acidobacteriaceae bacterium]
MATFCTKCGASLSSDAGFCTTCGAPIAAAAAAAPPPPEVAAAAPPAAQAPPPVYAQPAAAYPPPQKSGSALKIILIVVAVVFGIGVIGVGVFGYIGYRALHAAGNSLSLGGSADVSDADLGVTVYPGSTHSSNGSMRLKAANNLVVSSMYTTPDPPASVLNYYQGQLGSKSGATINVRENGEATTLTSASVDGGAKESIVVTITPQASLNQTQIMIVHTKVASSSQ